MRTIVVWSTALLVVAGCKDETPRPAPQPVTPAPLPSATKPGEITITSTSRDAVEAFRRGRELIEDGRDMEAEVQFERALEMDPNFALAHAYLGQAMPDPDGRRHIRQAVTLAAPLPEAERLDVERIAASRQGEEAKASELRKK